MKLFLAATHCKAYISNLDQCPYILESFYYVKPWQIRLLKNCRMFLLDSGAFTFMSSTTNVDWHTYIQQYVQFINRYDIRHFFELDIDNIVGLKNVERIRGFIEKETNKQCIPVWHKGRGLSYWKDMCKAYDYVAIGGIVTKEIRPEQYGVFKKLNQIAKDCGTKVHGLGFTGKNAEHYGFYSVDSSTWTSGGRYGQIHFFDGQGMSKKRPTGRRVKDFHALDQYNFNQWLKYQRYLERF